MVSRVVASGMMVLAWATPCLVVAANRFVSNDGTWKMKDESGQEMEGTCYTSLTNALVSSSGHVIYVKNDYDGTKDILPMISDGSSDARYSLPGNVTIRSESGDWRTGPTLYGRHAPDTASGIGAGAFRVFGKTGINATGNVIIGFKLLDGATSSTSSDMGHAPAGAGGCVCGKGERERVVVRNCLLSGGAAGTGGAAMRCTLEDCVISNSVALSTGGACTDCNLIGCEVWNNVAGSGGKNENGGGLYQCPAVTNCLISGNSCLGQGGGAYGCDVLYGCVVSNNTSNGNGGGQSEGSAYYCTNVCNVAEGRGGGFFGVKRAVGCVLANNKATAGYGGGSALQGISDAVYEGCLIYGNEASEEGGGVCCSISGCVFRNCIVSNNVAKTSGGGAYRGQIEGGTVVGNRAGASGGGLSSCSATGVRILGNVAQSGGGAAGVGVFDTCEFWDNVATNGNGGAYADTAQNNVTPAVFTNCLFAGNVCGDFLNPDVQKYGGAVVGGGSGGQGAYAELVGCVVSNNVCHGQYGGGTHRTNSRNTIYVGNRTMGVYGNTNRGGGGANGGTHYNSLFIYNTDGGGAGGVLSGSLYNCTVTGNTNASTKATLAGGMYVALAVNTISWGNVGAGDSATVASNSCLQVKAPTAKQVDCINTDPKLDAGLRPHARACKHTGRFFDWMTDEADVRSKDLAGNPRIAEGAERPNMGCYESLPVGLMLLLR